MMKTQQQREKLDKKLEEHIEKREAYLNDIKSKLKDHVSCSNSIEVHSNHFFFIFDHFLAGRFFVFLYLSHFECRCIGIPFFFIYQKIILLLNGLDNYHSVFGLSFIFYKS